MYLDARYENLGMGMGMGMEGAGGMGSEDFWVKVLRVEGEGLMGAAH